MAKKTSDKLTCHWSKKFKHITYTYPKPNYGKALNFFFKVTTNEHRRNLISELEEQGFDLTTLKFEIKLKKQKED